MTFAIPKPQNNKNILPHLMRWSTRRQCYTYRRVSRTYGSRGSTRARLNARRTQRLWTAPDCSRTTRPLEDLPGSKGSRIYDARRRGRYALPGIDNLLHSTQRPKLIFTIDLQSGYWQVPVRVEDRDKTCFISPFGLCRLGYATPRPDFND